MVHLSSFVNDVMSFEDRRILVHGGCNHFQLGLRSDQRHETSQLLVRDLDFIKHEEFNVARIVAIFLKIEISVIIEKFRYFFSRKTFKESFLKADVYSRRESWISMFLCGYPVRVLNGVEVIVALRAVCLKHHFVNPCLRIVPFKI
jgi:hypothetical protein